MIVIIGRGGRIGLGDPHDFKRFHLSLDRSAVDRVPDAISLAGTGGEIGAKEASAKDVLPEDAWVSIAALRALDGVAGDEAWQQSFTAMIDKARPHGWIDDQAGAIKAHIVWT